MQIITNINFGLFDYLRSLINKVISTSVNILFARSVMSSFQQGQQILR